MEDTRFSVSIQIMMILAYNDGELSSSEYLSKSLKTNPTFIRKLVSHLVGAGLIQSFRGKSGGIKLAKPTNEILLNDIYLAAQSNKRLISLHQKPVVKNCPVSCCIENVLEELINGIESSTHKYLSKKTLKDLMKNV